MPKKVDVVVVALSSPIYIGIYEEGKLIQRIESDKRSSDILPSIFEDIMNRYIIQALYYANGPGSFMAIKVVYIFLKSLSILKNIPLFATDAFYFNDNQPIKAIGKLVFVKSSNNNITTQKVEVIPPMKFELPQHLEPTHFSTDTSPLYAIDAVGA